MATTRITPDQDAVVSEIEIAVPPERVFRALVDRNEALKWGSGETHEITVWEMDARPGGKWEFISREKSGKNPDGKPRQFEHRGEVLEIDPPRLLVHTWLANFHHDPKGRSVVRWELTPIKSGTHVKLTHSGLAHEPESCKDYAGGWPGVLAQLKTDIEK